MANFKSCSLFILDLLVNVYFFLPEQRILIKYKIILTFLPKSVLLGKIFK